MLIQFISLFFRFFNFFAVMPFVMLTATASIAKATPKKIVSIAFMCPPYKQPRSFNTDTTVCAISAIVAFPSRTT